MKDRLIETREIAGHIYETWAQQQFGWRRGGQERIVYKMDGKRIAKDAYRAALGEDVSEVERATCQICERAIGVKTGVIAHHGYRRPYYGSGHQTASCYGARRLCWEQDRSALGEVITGLKEELTRRDASVAQMRQTPSKVVIRDARIRNGRWIDPVYCEPDDPRYGSYQRGWFDRMARERVMLVDDIAHQEARYAAWSPQPKE